MEAVAALFGDPDVTAAERGDRFWAVVWVPPSLADDPVAPADPAVSANAKAGEAMAAPIPKATASAPTRPTYRAEPDSPELSRPLRGRTTRTG